MTQETKLLTNTAGILVRGDGHEMDTYPPVIAAMKQNKGDEGMASEEWLLFKRKRKCQEKALGEGDI